MPRLAGLYAIFGPDVWRPVVPSGLDDHFTTYVLPRKKRRKSALPSPDLRPIWLQLYEYGRITDDEMLMLMNEDA